MALAAVVAAMSSLNVALPEIARATHATQTQLAWIIDAYSLVFAAILLPAGAIGDRYGRRLALIAGLVVFGGASAAAMTAHSAGELIGLRAVMGLGAALVMQATLSTITGTFADEQRTRAVSVWAAVAGGAAVLGLLVSGLILEVWSWPSVFGLNVILAAAAVTGTIRFVPESAEHDTRASTWTGALLAVTGLVALVYSIIEAPGQGWTSARTLASLAAGLVILVGFVAFEQRRRARCWTRGSSPTAAWPRAACRSSCSSSPCSASSSSSCSTCSSSGATAGWSRRSACCPWPPSMMPSARLAPALAARLGAPGRPASTGLALIAAAMVILAQLNPGQRLLAPRRRTDPARRRDGPGHDPGDQRHHLGAASGRAGRGIGLNDLSREVGGAIGMAVLASLLTGA